jgi:hypothetical protein
MADPRVKAAVLLALTGTGGADLIATSVAGTQPASWLPAAAAGVQSSSSSVTARWTDPISASASSRRKAMTRIVLHAVVSSLPFGFLPSALAAVVSH